MGYGGRPTSYREKYCEMVVKHLEGGQSLASFARSVGTHREVLWTWRQKHPEFNNACLAGLEAAQVWWENLATIVATGKNMDPETDSKSANYGKPKLPYTNPGMIMFLMKQRFADYRKDRTLAEELNPLPAINITVNTNEIDDEIEQRLKQREARKRRKSIEPPEDGIYRGSKE